MEQKLLFGLKLETSQKMREEVEREINRKCPAIQSVCRYRKEGVIQYLSPQDRAIAVIEENLQGGSPYSSEELQQLTDLGGHHIIFLLDPCHRGDEYVKELYSCGIYDGIYQDQANAREVLKLIYQGRNCQQARDYYGIMNSRDAERKNNIVNEEVLGTYLEFIENAGTAEDTDQRYRFVTSRLGAEENRMLVYSLSRPVAERLVGNEIFQFYKSTKEKRRGLARIIGKRKQEGTVSESLGVNAASQPETAPLSESILQSREQRPVEEIRTEGGENAGKTKCDDVEDMLSVLDRFRLVADEGQVGAFYEPEEDLREVLGSFFKNVDS